MKKMMTGHSSKVSTKKPTAPLLGAKTAAELFVHVIRKSPCVRGVSATIMHSCAARRKTHLNRLQSILKFHWLDCCISARRGTILVRF